MTLSDFPAHWWVLGYFAITLLIVVGLLVAYGVRRRAPRRHWLCADLGAVEDMASFEACDRVTVVFASAEEAAEMMREDAELFEWRYQDLRWGAVILPTEDDGDVSSPILGAFRPKLAPSEVLVIERNGRWQVLIGPLISAEHQQRILLSDAGYPEEVLSISRVYRNWKHPRLPPLVA